MDSAAPDLSSVIPGPNETLTVQAINDQIIPLLLTHFSNLRGSIPRLLITALPAPDPADPESSGLDRQVASNTTKKPSKRRNKTKTKTKKEKIGDGNIHKNNNSSHSDVPDDEAQLCEQIDLLQRDLSYIREELDRLKRSEESVGGLVRALLEHCLSAFQGLKQAQAQAVDPDGSSGGGNARLQPNQMQINLSLVTSFISRLKLQIPFSRRILSASSDAHRYEQALDETVAGSPFDYLREPRVGGDSLWSSAYKDFFSAYRLLDPQLKLCLLCFAVFPEQAVIKKRVMSYWWAGEGLLDAALNEQKATAGDVLKELASKGFIRPINKKRRLGAKSYKMLPIVRLMVMKLAKEANFFDFDSNGCPTANFSESLRACLVKSEQGSLQNTLKNKPEIDFERLHTLFNVNEKFLDLKSDWFMKMRNVSVLSLGRWEGSRCHHIEVKGTEFFNGLAGMKNLRFLSLQGISRIFKLHHSLGELHNLKILDLRDCHNLESLPDEISELKELTNLDVSGCYLLDSLPKGIGSLSKLEVVMGFVISDSRRGTHCTLRDLGKLGKLRKLGIVTTRESFPESRELYVLRRFRALKKLTVTWGGKCFSSKPLKERRNSPPARDGNLLSTLEKLDLQCYPLSDPPAWLAPGVLTGLKTLYIRGGNLHHLGGGAERNQGDRWKVTTLRLRYLNEFRMNWIELRDSFPELVCLEKINCPRLALLPCDETGVWLNEELDKASRFNKNDGGRTAG